MTYVCDFRIFAFLTSQLNVTLDNLERRIHDISVQETDENDILRR